MGDDFPKLATVIITSAGQSVTLSFDDSDDALDLHDDIVARFDDHPPQEPVEIVLTGGAFSWHTRRYPRTSRTEREPTP